LTTYWTFRFGPSCFSTFFISVNGETSWDRYGSSHRWCKFSNLWSRYVFHLCFCKIYFSLYFWAYKSHMQVVSIPLLASYPYIALLSGLSLAFVLNCASVAKNVLSVSAYTSRRYNSNLTIHQIDYIKPTFSFFFYLFTPSLFSLLWLWQLKMSTSNVASLPIFLGGGYKWVSYL
jgi:hypothetical protein